MALNFVQILKFPDAKTQKNSFHKLKPKQQYRVYKYVFNSARKESSIGVPMADHFKVSGENRLNYETIVGRNNVV